MAEEITAFVLLSGMIEVPGSAEDLRAPFLGPGLIQDGNEPGLAVS